MTAKRNITDYIVNGEAECRGHSETHARAWIPVEHFTPSKIPEKICRRCFEARKKDRKQKAAATKDKKVQALIDAARKAQEGYADDVYEEALQAIGGPKGLASMFAEMCKGELKMNTVASQGLRFLFTESAKRTAASDAEIRDAELADDQDLIATLNRSLEGINVKSTRRMFDDCRAVIGKELEDKTNQIREKGTRCGSDSTAVALLKRILDKFDLIEQATFGGMDFDEEAA